MRALSFLALLISFNIVFLKAQTAQVKVRKGKSGLVSHEGKKILPFKYDSITELSAVKKKLYKAWQKNRCYLFDGAGKGGEIFMADEIYPVKRYPGKEYLVILKGGESARIVFGEYYARLPMVPVPDSIRGFKILLGGKMGLFDPEKMSWVTKPENDNIYFPVDFSVAIDSIVKEPTDSLNPPFYYLNLRDPGAIDIPSYMISRLPLIIKTGRGKYSLCAWDEKLVEPAISADTIFLFQNHFYAWSNKRLLVYDRNGKRKYPYLQSTSPVYRNRWILFADEVEVRPQGGTLNPFIYRLTRAKTLPDRIDTTRYVDYADLNVFARQVGIYDLMKMDTVVAPEYSAYYFYSPEVCPAGDSAVQHFQVISKNPGVPEPPKNKPYPFAGIRDGIYEKQRTWLIPQDLSVKQDWRQDNVNPDFPFWGKNGEGFMLLGTNGKPLLKSLVKDLSFHCLGYGKGLYHTRNLNGSASLYHINGSNALPLSEYDSIEVLDDGVKVVKNGKEEKIKIFK
jgi:hypothetical protein